MYRFLLRKCETAARRRARPHAPVTTWPCSRAQSRAACAVGSRRCASTNGGKGVNLRAATGRSWVESAPTLRARSSTHRWCRSRSTPRPAPISKCCRPICRRLTSRIQQSSSAATSRRSVLTPRALTRIPSRHSTHAPTRTPPRAIRARPATHPRAPPTRRTSLNPSTTSKRSRPRSPNGSPTSGCARPTIGSGPGRRRAPCRPADACMCPHVHERTCECLNGCEPRCQRMSAGAQHADQHHRAWATTSSGVPKLVRRL